MGVLSRPRKLSIITRNPYLAGIRRPEGFRLYFICSGRSHNKLNPAGLIGRLDGNLPVVDSYFIVGGGSGGEKAE